jgi:hypothetical protein
MERGQPARGATAVAWLALALNIVIALASLVASLIAADLALARPRTWIVLAASLFGVAAILLFWEAIAIMRQSRTGTMPIAIFSKRPLGWVALAAIAIASIPLLNLFAGIMPD